MGMMTSPQRETRGGVGLANLAPAPASCGQNKNAKAFLFRLDSLFRLRTIYCKGFGFKAALPRSQQHSSITRQTGEHTRLAGCDIWCPPTCCWRPENPHRTRNPASRASNALAGAAVGCRGRQGACQGDVSSDVTPRLLTFARNRPDRHQTSRSSDRAPQVRHSRHRHLPCWEGGN